MTLTQNEPGAVAAAARTGTGATLWLTGLPSAGKTTIARALADVLADRGVDFEILDGDELRIHLSAALGFSREDRDIQVTRTGFIAELLARHGVVVVVPVIAPYADARAKVRAHHERRGTTLLEVHVSTPFQVCADRDVKGLYARALLGEITSMTGVNDPYEVPENPDLRLDTSVLPLDESVTMLLTLLARKGSV